MEKHTVFMKQAIALAKQGMNAGKGGPFGAVIVKEGEIIAEACNMVTSINDPTAHAEISAIRKACEKLKTFDLSNCTLYTSCEPCPMCLGAIYWANISTVFYACKKEDAANIGFDDQFIYEEFEANINERKVKFSPLLREESLRIFQEWSNKEDAIMY